MVQLNPYYEKWEKDATIYKFGVSLATAKKRMEDES